MTGEHTSRKFDTELEAVRARVLHMGGLVETQLRNTILALNTSDLKQLEAIVFEDRQVNQLEQEIDERCNVIIARRQPAANDLRELISITKIITDLERMGDAAKKIARLGGMQLDRNALMQPRFHEVVHAIGLALEVLLDTLDAFARHDMSMAVQVMYEDQRMEEEFEVVMRHLVSYMMENPRTISTSLDILLMIKAVENIGVHARSIAKQLIYLIRGQDVRHLSVEMTAQKIRYGVSSDPLGRRGSILE